MNEHVCPEENALRQPQTAKIKHLPASAPSFSLRRAHYFGQSRKSPLTAEQLKALIKRVREGDADARRKIIAAHMHLVIDFAKHYANRGLAPLDLIRAGIQGLIQALEEFEPVGCSSFIAFATSYICETIERAILNWSTSFRRISGLAADRPAARSPMPAVLPKKPFNIIGGCFGVPA